MGYRSLRINVAFFPTSKIARMRRDRRSGRKGTVCCRFFVVPVAHQRRILGTLLFLVLPQARRNPVQDAKKIVVAGFSPHLARPGQNGKFSVLGFRCAWHNPMQSAMEMTASGFYASLGATQRKMQRFFGAT